MTSPNNKGLPERFLLQPDIEKYANHRGGSFRLEKRHPIQHPGSNCRIRTRNGDPGRFRSADEKRHDTQHFGLARRNPVAA